MSSDYSHITAQSSEFKVDVLGKLDRMKGERDRVLADLEKAKEQSLSFEKRHSDSVKALEVVRKIAQETQKKLEYHMSNLVTLALTTVFDDPYEFKIKFEQRRNKTECDLVFVKDGIEYGDTLFTTGGGANDVAAFALRCSFWSLNRTRPVMVLDEPFKFVNDDPTTDARVLQKKCADMLKMVSEKLDLQMIVITTLPEFLGVADKIFNVTQRKGISEVTVIDI